MGQLWQLSAYTHTTSCCQKCVEKKGGIEVGGQLLCSFFDCLSTRRCSSFGLSSQTFEIERKGCEKERNFKTSTVIYLMLSFKPNNKNAETLSLLIKATHDLLCGRNAHNQNVVQINYE